MRTLGKITFIIILISLALPLVKTSCDFSVLAAVQDAHAPMCHMGSLTAARQSLDLLPHFDMALVEPIRLSVWVVLLLLAAAGVLLVSVRYRVSGWLDRMRRAISDHMKYWDPLRFALAAGVVQRVTHQ